MARLPRSKRRLGFDSLESRRMMAGDFHFGHNFVSPEDTDGSGIVSPIDALRVINAINAGVTASTESLDVTADDALTPMDALMVINHLNIAQTSTETSVASSVSRTARISRIEAALASGELPANLTTDDAQAVLETLELGGAPELGDCPGAVTGDPAVALESLAERLTDLGVATETVDKVVSEIQGLLDAGETFRSAVETVLEDNSIDLRSLIQQQHATDSIQRLAAKLSELGIDQTVIDQITTELTDAVNAGTPLTHAQLVARLTELGIDPATVFAGAGHGNDNQDADDTVSADEVAARLEKMGVDATIITTIVTEIEAAAEAGTPMTRSELAARLQELGVITRKPHRIGQSRRG